MKVSKNLNQDLKDEIEELGNRCSKLQIFYDDQQEIMQREKDRSKKEIYELSAMRVLALKDEELKTMAAEKDQMKKELDEYIRKEARYGDEKERLFWSKQFKEKLTLF